MTQIMRPFLSPLLVLAVSVLLATSGCRQKATTEVELDKAVSALSTAVTAPATSPEAIPVAAPSQQMREAVEAYKSGKLEDSVTRLQALRATATMTPEQRLAFNDAMAAVMSDIYARAAKGDARAAEAVKKYELLQNQRR